MNSLIFGMNTLLISVFLLSLVLVFIFIELNYWSRKINKKISLQKEQIDFLMKQLAEKR